MRPGAGALQPAGQEARGNRYVEPGWSLSVVGWTRGRVPSSLHPFVPLSLRDFLYPVVGFPTVDAVYKHPAGLHRPLHLPAMLLTARLLRIPVIVAYDGFEPSGRMHIAQGVMKALNVNKLTKSGVHFKFWVADWFAQLNNKMGGDLKKIQVVGKYLVEIWRALVRRVRAADLCLAALAPGSVAAH